MRYLFIKLFIVLIIGLNFTNCARRGNPTGGPIDSLPPVVVKTDPELKKTNFKADKIKIYFDEYIKIKDLKKNLIISPPQKNEPVIYPVGTASKYISIEILDTL
ncbi:MAG TPA: Ig-like domain-containing protein, partial [Flavobacteriaceae bacterium]|nr:Ig-like domain-containing protein [Flavobacteriaceae bacterium]